MTTLKDTTKKVLVGTPTSHHKKYCQKDFIENVKAFTYPNFSCLIVDNSPDSVNYLELLELTKGDDRFIIVHRPNENPKAPIKDLLLDSTQYIYNYFFEHGFDSWFSLESDNFPPINIIEHLISLDRQVVGIPYLHFQRDKTRLLASEFYMCKGLQLNDYMTPRNAALFMDGTVKANQQFGIGCLLIHKSALAQIKIRKENEGKNEIRFQPPDYYLQYDLYVKGIKAYLDTRFICEHRNTKDNWDEIQKALQ